MNKDALKSFEEYCGAQKLKITPPRLSAFKIIHSADKPLTAYDILEAMGRDIKNPKPPTAYRALDFLVEHGFVHRIESLNAFVSCDVNHKHAGSQFMICDSCGNVDEIHLCTLPPKLQDKVESEKFTLHHWNVELHGFCLRCA